MPLEQGPSPGTGAGPQAINPNSSKSFNSTRSRPIGMQPVRLLPSMWNDLRFVNPASSTGISPVN